MSLAEHLHPKTYWEERCELLEDSMFQLMRLLAATQSPQTAQVLAAHAQEWAREISSLAAKHPPKEPT